MKFIFKPNKSVGRVEFGMSRDEVRCILPGFKKEFKKSFFSKTTTDEFECCHVYYDDKGKCIAIELFNTNQLIYAENNLFMLKFDELKNLFPDIIEEYGSYCSKKYSIGVGFEENGVESILVGCKDYYL